MHRLPRIQRYPTSKSRINLLQGFVCCNNHISKPNLRLFKISASDFVTPAVFTCCYRPPAKLWATEDRPRPSSREWSAKVIAYPLGSYRAWSWLVFLSKTTITVWIPKCVRTYVQPCGSCEFRTSVLADHVQAIRVFNLGKVLHWSCSGYCTIKVNSFEAYYVRKNSSNHYFY